MPEVPKIVHERLRAASGAAAGDAHPDANVLTAFAEQALSVTERESVLAHLSICDECRELLAVRSPDLEVVPTVGTEHVPLRSVDRVPVTGRGAWFAWHRLGWAGLAAGLVIAVGVVVTQSGKHKTLEDARQNSTSAPAAAPVSTTNTKQVAALPSTEPSVSAENKPIALPPRRDELKTFAAPVPALKEPVAVENKIEASGKKKDSGVDLALKTSLPSTASANETVDVTSEAPALSAANKDTDTLAADEAAPVMRAKAARALDAPAPLQTVGARRAEAQKETAGAVGAQTRTSSPLQQMQLNGSGQNVAYAVPQLSAQWRIQSDHVEKSLDSGAHWNSVFTSKHPLLSVAGTNADVWAGGKSGELYHSSDSGITWNQVHPATNGQTLADDITHIDVYGATKIVLSTSKNETWSSIDGGTTWDKK